MHAAPRLPLGGPSVNPTDHTPVRIEPVMFTKLSSRLAIAAAAALIAAPAAAQEAPQPITARNAVYVELLGNGLLYSVNYDRLFTDNVSGRIGAMFVAGEDEEGDSGYALITPIIASYLFGQGSSKFEAGLGVALGYASVDGLDFGEEGAGVDESGAGVIGTGVLGYRYQRPDGGFVFRVGLTPLFDDSGFAPWFGVSFGYGF